MHFAAGPQARWLGASDEHTLWYVMSEQQRQRACGPQPYKGRGAKVYRLSPELSRVVARTGLRMMPTFPPPPLTFRTAGFPQYG